MRPTALAVSAVLLGSALNAQSGRGRAPAPAPRLVGEGVVSTPDYEGSATLTADGGTLYFAKRPPVSYFWVICASRRSNGSWSAPFVAEFSGRASDADPFVSPDGRRLFFASNRAAQGAGTKRDYDIWVVERSGDAWSEPRRLPAPVNSDREELHPSVDREGTLYFASNRPGAAGLDVYSAAHVDGRYEAPVRLAGVSASGPDTHPSISPDGRTLVFASSGRPDQPLPTGVPYSRTDLYLSARGPAGWTDPRRLPEPINSLAAELSPAFTADGERLLFVSERGFATEPAARPFSYGAFMAGLRSVHNGLGNLYEVDVRAVLDPS